MPDHQSFLRSLFRLLPLGRRAARAPITPITLSAVVFGLVSTAVLATIALSAAAVRVLPWALDPRMPWRVALPFARAVASVALEAAILVGWPVGWALAAFASCERGDARVLALLGERPARTTLRLAPSALVFGAVLAAASLAGGKDASEPGRVVAELLRAGKAACAREPARRAFDVPVIGASWFCVGVGVGVGETGVGKTGVETGGPRVVGPAALGLATSGSGEALYTARDIDVSADARRVELDDAWLATRAATLHVNRAVFRLPPFVRASSLPAAWRALFLASSGGLSAMLAIWFLLRLRPSTDDGASSWRLHAILLGAAGPVSALALLRVLEVAPAPMPLRLYALLPVAASGATWLASLALGSARLPWSRATATK